MAQRGRCPGGRPSVSEKQAKVGIRNMAIVQTRDFMTRRVDEQSPRCQNRETIEESIWSSLLCSILVAWSFRCCCPIVPSLPDKLKSLLCSILYKRLRLSNLFQCSFLYRSYYLFPQDSVKLELQIAETPYSWSNLSNSSAMWFRKQGCRSVWVVKNYVESSEK